MARSRENVIRSAEKYVSRGKLEAAIKEYRKVLAENPNDINTLNRVGDLYARLERYDEAVKLFSQIAEKYTRDGFFVKAIAIYKKIIKLDPTSLMVYERLAELYYKQGLLNEARTQYQVLADYYQKHNNATSAITIYQRMSEMEPDNPSFHLKLAELYSSRHLTDKALREYRTLADLLLVGGSVDEAVQVYNKALELGSSNLAFIRDVVRDLHDGGHVGASAKVLAKAVELNPDASQLAAQVGLTQPALLDSGGATEPEVEPTAVDDPLDATGFESGDEESDFDDTFHVADTSFDDVEVSFDPPSGFVDVDTQPSIEPLAESSAEIAVEPSAEPPVDSSFGDTSFGDTSFGDTSFVDQSTEGTGVGFAPDSFAPDSFASNDFAPDSGSQDGSFAKVDEEVFSLDLDDDEIPDSMVLPPADLQQDSAAFDAVETFDSEAFSAAEHQESQELDLEIEPLAIDAADFGIGSDDAEKSGGADDLEDATLITTVDPEAEPDSIEIDWSLDAMADLEMSVDSADTTEPAEDPGDSTQLVRDFDMSFVGDSNVDSAVAEDETLPSAESVLPAEVVPAVVTPAVEDAQLERIESDPQEFDELVLEEAAADQPATVEAGSLEDVSLEDVPLQGAPAVAAEAEPPAVRREEDLLAEAKVFAKYGLLEKAYDRLGELLTGQPGHVEGLALATRLALTSETPEQVLEHANGVAERATSTADDEVWQELRDELVAAGYGSDGQRIVSIPGAKPPQDDRIAQLLDDLSIDSFDRPTVPPEVEVATDVDTMAEALDRAAPTVEAGPPNVAIDQPMPPATQVPADDAVELISLVDELGLDELDEDDELVEAISANAPSAAEDPADQLDETGMSWLDDVAAEAEAADADSGSDSADAIFDEEDDFFDLAAELEAELQGDDSDADAAGVEPQEQSLEEIIEGFKQGVAENLSPEDYDTHFNLGIAYREMGLLDEAIGEFQLASKDERYLLDCASMLGVCFLEKGLPELAVRWYRKGLEAPNIREQATLGMLYDMAGAYETMDDEQAAYKTYVEIYGLNSSFRDVSTKMQELAARQPS